ncbi:MAG: D-alanyl-D-alanine carboxypeptidase family protein [Ruminococcus sp.]|nr:D-alanyl-D-alanine carboxypeptidase family protein [Ruminococcus sp.]
MADSSVFRRLRYKNVALALAVMLLTVLAIGRACSDELPTQRDTESTSSAAEPASTESEASTIAPFEATGLGENFSYFNVRNAEALGEGDLVLLNSAFRNDSTPGDLDSVYTYLFDRSGAQIAWATTTSLQGSRRMLTSLNEMLCAFHDKTGLTTIMINELYTPSKDERSKPCLEHDSALAVDFQLCLQEEKTYPPFTGEGDYAWFSRNSYRYGFIERYPVGKEAATGVEAVPSHYRYVGKPHAEIMMYNDLCLEEYIDLIKQYSLSSPFSFESEDGSRYAVFYVEKSEDKSTNIPIPRDENNNERICDISGDGRNGFIVTVYFDEETEAGDTTSAEE